MLSPKEKETALQAGCTLLSKAQMRGGLGRFHFQPGSSFRMTGLAAVDEAGRQAGSEVSNYSRIYANRYYSIRLMEAFRMIDNFTRQVGINGCLDFVDICNDRLDAARGECIMGTHTHPACQQHLAVSNAVHHGAVPLLGSRVRAVTFPGLMDMQSLFGKLGMTGFGARFLRHDLPVFHGEDLVMLRPPEMGGYGLEIIGNDSDFHGYPSRQWI